MTESRAPESPTATGPRNVLITGASGYIGRRVVAALASRPGPVQRIVATDLAPTGHAVGAGVIEEPADLRTDAVVRLIERYDIDTVVHLAAVVTPPRGVGRGLAYEIDVEGTRRLLDGCVSHGVAHLVVTSSGAAYGYHADNPPLIDEDQPLRGNPEFAYAHHKHLVEEMLAAARVEHPALGQLVLRPGTVIGPDAHNQITAMFERPVVLGLSDAATPFVFVLDDDVAEIVAIGVRERRVGTYNLAGDGVMTLREVAVAMGRPYVALPSAWIGAGLTALSRLGRAPYGPEQVMFLKHRPVLANRRLKVEFGYRPRTSREAFEAYRAARVGGRV